MATGFIGSGRVLWSAHSIFVMCGLLTTSMVQATEVSLVGLFSGKALVVIDGGRPRTVVLGIATGEGVKLLAVEDGAAQFEIDGRRQRLVVGQHAVSTGGESRAAVVTLTADPSGHFVTVGTINGVPVHLLVDTGATFVSMGMADAVKANVDFQNGEPGMATTANGLAKVWRVKLNSVRVGDVLLNEVDAVVHEGNLPVVLLGMSFLNRMEMKRDGPTMTLKKRF
jgi:aspartyl protease family protein